jgi:hypothetical protein
MVQLSALWRDGIVWTRWLPDLAFGNGMPLFNYYAPLVYYLTTPFALAGLGVLLALNLSLAAALVSGAVGMFFLACGLVPKQTSPLAPFVSALAYLYAPYLLFNALARGNLAEQWALALAPFALWRFWKLSSEPGAWNWILAVLAAAAALLAHNVTGFFLAPLLFGFGIVSWAALLPGGAGAEVQAPGLARAHAPLNAPTATRALALGSAFVAALALASFFWLPALLERDYIQIARVIVTPDFDYRFNFVVPTELVALLPRADTGRLNPAYPATLGLVQVLLACTGVLLWMVKGRSRRTLPLGYLAAAALVLVMLMLSFSQPVWDRVSLLAFVQLPMRLRGLAALSMAPLAGLPLAWLTGRRQILAAAAVSSALVVSALPLLYPRYARDTPPQPTLTDMLAYERRTGTLGTTSFGEYLPVWVQDVPDALPMSQAYAQNRIPDRFLIPQGVESCGETLTRLSETVCVNAPVGWRALYRAFFFPGVSAGIDNTLVEARPNPRDGLVTFDVPPGKHTLTVAFSSTPLESQADWITLCAALLVLGVTGYALLHRQPAAAPDESGVRLPPLPLAALALVGLALLGLKFFYLDHVSNPIVTHFDGVHIDGFAAPRPVRFDNALELLGWDTGGTVFKTGDTVRTTLYWRALPALDTNLSTFVHLTAPDGFVHAQQDNLHPANLPTTRWDMDAYAADVHRFIIPPDLPPGEYDLRAGVYNPATRVRLKPPGGADYVLLAKIQVVADKK